MRFQIPSFLLALSATAVSASGPFLLHITGRDKITTLDGYGVACHTGAAEEGLCYAEVNETEAAASTSYQFYFEPNNYTSVNGAEVGTLSWHLPYDGGAGELNEELMFSYQPNSNIAVPWFEETASNIGVGFDKSGKLFVYTYIDDSTFKPNKVPTGGDYALYNWQVCWLEFAGYYYEAVGWAQTLPAHNPTCNAVNVILEEI